MSWMQFLIELIDKLIWPTVVIFCIYRLHRPLAALIPLAKKLKFKEFEVEFGQELKAASQNAVRAFPELKQDKKSILIAASENLPNSAVLEAWETVDEAAEVLIKSRISDVKLDLNTRYKHIENILVQGDIIDTKKGKLFSELRQLRNKVAHAKGFEVGKSESIQYVELCFKLTDYLKAVTAANSSLTQ